MSKYFLLLSFSLMVGCVTMPQGAPSWLPFNNGYSEEELNQNKDNSQELLVNGVDLNNDINFEQPPTGEEFSAMINQYVEPPGQDCEEFKREYAEIEASRPPKVEKLFDGTRQTLYENFIKLGGSPLAFEQTMCFFDENKDTTFDAKGSGNTEIKNEDYVVIQDFTKPYYEQRYFLLNMKTGEVNSMFSPHGVGNPKSEQFNGHYSNPVPKYFSNDKYTNLSSRGFSISAERDSASHNPWPWRMWLDGVQEGVNGNLRNRGSYFHPGNGSSREFLTYEGMSSSNESDPVLTVSDDLKEFNPPVGWGCNIVHPSHAEYVYERTKGGALFYNYTHHEEKLGSDYCGHNLRVAE